MAKSDPEFTSAIQRRVKAVIQDIVDGCNNCHDQGLCREHLQVAKDLTLNPRQLLDKLEREYSGSTK